VPQLSHRHSRHASPLQTSPRSGSGGYHPSNSEVLALMREEGPDGGLDEGDDGGDRELYLRLAQEVVTESNRRAARGEDPLWQTMNDDNQGVTSDIGTQPPAWRRGVKCGDGEFSLANGGRQGGLEDFDDFKQQIQDDLNFNGVFDAYSSVETFQSAVVARYGEESACIAENLWAYAKTGADVTGKTDVSELQGLLYALDPQVAQASRSNTKHEGPLSVPGTEQVVPGADGDEWYGRATMLQCRLLSSVLDSELIPEVTITTTIEQTTQVVEEMPDGEPDDDCFSKSTYIFDVSDSMFDDFDILRDYMDQIDSGDARFAGMLGSADPMVWHAGGAEISQDEGRALMAELDKLKLQRGHGRRDDATGVTSMFVDTDRLKDPDGVVAQSAGGAHDESSLQKVYDLLKEASEGPRPERLEGEQIVVSTDEGDSNPELIKQVWTLGRQLGVLVKILYLSRDTVTEIPLTSLPEEYIDLMFEDSQLPGQDPGRFTVVENNRNASTSEDGQHRRLAWGRVISDWNRNHDAYGGEAFQRYDKISDRTPRR